MAQRQPRSRSPAASATPNGGACSDAGGSVNCLGPGKQQVYTSINPRWRDIGYSARYPKYGFDPKWQAFGYNPLYSGFRRRPSVMKPFRLNGIQSERLPAAKLTDNGGSTIYQTAGHAQITAKPGPVAQSAADQAAFFPVPDLPRA